MTDKEEYPHKPNVGDRVVLAGMQHIGVVTAVYDYGNFDHTYEKDGRTIHAVSAWNWPGDSALNHYRILRRPIIIINT